MKLYESKAWLRVQHYTKKKRVEQIAKECNVSAMTIRRAMERHGIRIVSW